MNQATAIRAVRAFISDAARSIAVIASDGGDCGVDGEDNLEVRRAAGGNWQDAKEAAAQARELKGAGGEVGSKFLFFTF
jgi:hypothetical protein